MADIDFLTDLRGNFTISLGNSPASVSGNRALLNRFELTFMTKRRQFLFNDEKIIADNYGGDADKFVNKPMVLSDIQGISAALSVAIDQTVSSMQTDESAGIPNTEKISSAELTSVDIIGEVVTAKIRVQPVEVQRYSVLELNLPIVRRS